jgi:hypothetical protein
MSTAPGGGLSTAPGGGLSTAPRGGLSTAPGGGLYTGAIGPNGKRYHSNQPPKHILLSELRKRGMVNALAILNRAGIY